MQSETPATEPAAPKGLKRAGIIAALIAVGVVAAGTISRAHETNAAETWSDARSIPTVQLVAVKASAATDALALPGTMQAWNAAKLYARVNGYLNAWYRDIGAIVPAGTPLARSTRPSSTSRLRRHAPKW
ncbi:hypothetical protein [Sphingomonas paeninsulae]|uniref:hypothetical protein n=1 Tax=Sphingomonas paeninsulae TaxID=2319844 RepID=UPI001EF0EF20|nr:hypothetical protein [Sphingomonas paeninsulae]